MKRFAKAFGLVLLLGCAHVPGARADEVKVRVLDANGAPVANAKVWLSPFSSRGESLVRATDGAGTLTQYIPPAPTGRGVLGRVTVYAPGWALGGTDLKARENEVRLDKPRALSGTVNDPLGRPVEGAVVRPSYIFKPGAGYQVTCVVGDTPEWAELFVRTDANGRWTLPYLPQEGSVYYELSDDRYARARGNAGLGPGATPEAKTLVARPSATITGRVLGPNGQPAPNVMVFASDDLGSAGRATTGQDGSYSLHRIGEGSFNLRLVRVKPDEFPAKPVQVLIKESETVRAPDILLIEGVFVEGTVVDAVSGAPLAGASVFVEQTSAPTGADGRFRVRALPGKNRIYVAGLPEGYGPPEVGSSSSVMNLTVPAAGTKDLVFKLPVAESLTGRVVDEQGAPATDVKLFVGQKWDRKPTVLGKDGTFTLKGLEKGEVTLSIDGDWILKQPAKIKLPHKEPVVVTVQRTTLPSLSGQVIDTNRQPVAGVEVQVTSAITVSDSSGTSHVAHLATDASGRYKLPKVRPENTYTVLAKKPGYRFVSGGKVSSNKEIMAISGQMIPNPNPTFTVGDIVLEKLAQSLSGVVRDEQGAPVSGAEVYATGGEGTVRTDGEGKFHLMALPAGDMDVYVAQGRLFANVRSKAGTLPDVVLQPLTPVAPTTAAGRALLDDLLAGDEFYYTDATLAALAVGDPDTALKLIGTMKPERQNSAAANALLAFAKRAPERARERIPDLLGALPKPLRGYEAVQLANEIVTYEPDAARAIYEREKAAIKPLNPANAKQDVQGLWMRAALGAVGVQLKAEGAEALVDEGVDTAVKALSGKDDYYALLRLGDAVAPGGSALVERVVAKLPAQNRAGLLARALPALARRDPPAAQRLLETIAALPEVASDQTMNQPDYAFGVGALAVIGHLGKTDPKAALALARRVTSDQHKSRALALAATFQPKDAAIAVLREALAVKTPYPDAAYQLPVAERAMAVDLKLAEEILVQIDKRLWDAQAEERGYRNSYQVAQLAYALAPVQPGRARLMLEREAGKEVNEDDWGRSSLILAMARIDFQRAEEMVRTITADAHEDGNRHWAQRHRISMLASYALMPEAVRSTMSFQRLQQGTVAQEEMEF